MKGLRIVFASAFDDCLLLRVSSIVVLKLESSGVSIVIAVPCFPARPVRPTLICGKKFRLIQQSNKATSEAQRESDCYPTYEYNLQDYLEVANL